MIGAIHTIFEYTERKNFEDKSQANLLAKNIVDENIIFEDLSKLEWNLSIQNYKLSIPKTKLVGYCQLPITKCSISKTCATIRLSIPIIGTDIE